MSLGLRTGFVVAALVPMAMIMALLVMSLFGIGLDQMSLAALIIALGMLVDNAIVMSESIMVQMASGKKAVAAAVDSARELQVPLLVSSATTAAAFLPIYLAESSTGEYTAPLFKVVSITLAVLVAARPDDDAAPVRLLSPRPKVEAEESFSSRGYRLYRRFLLLGLRHKAVALGIVGLCFGLALYGLGFVPNIFFPPNDKAILTAELSLPVGSPIERTEEVVQELERFLLDELVANDSRAEGITNWASFVSGGRSSLRAVLQPRAADARVRGARGERDVARRHPRRGHPAHGGVLLRELPDVAREHCASAARVPRRPRRWRSGSAGATWTRSSPSPTR